MGQVLPLVAARLTFHAGGALPMPACPSANKRVHCHVLVPEGRSILDPSTARRTIWKAVFMFERTADAWHSQSVTFSQGL